jgi:hypothetical protein
MRAKQMRSLAEIGIVYLAASIILDSILVGYKILLWPALAIAFLFFATLIAQVVWEPAVPTPARVMSVRSTHRDDDLTRLEQICKHAIEQEDRASGETLIERVRTLAIAVTSYRLNEPESSLMGTAPQHPVLLQKIKDQEMVAIITSPPLLGKAAVGTLQDYLTRIEEWTK